MTKKEAAPEAANVDVATEVTNPNVGIEAPSGSLCASCTLFDAGRCRTFLNAAEGTGEPVPFVTGCPDHTPEKSE